MSLQLREILQIAENRLRLEGCMDPRLDAELLLSHLLQTERSFFFTHAREPLNDNRCDLYFELVDVRASGVPVQYILGYQEFMGIRFKVNEAVLIPRQDTELIAEEALKELKMRKKPFGGFEVLDLCTGSGALAVSLGYYFPKLKLTATDISAEALAVAKENAQTYHLKDIEFVKSDLFEGLPVNEKKEKAKKQFDLIVSNPPYIATEVIPGLQREVREHEPILALNGGAEGLDFYVRIMEKISWFLKKDGLFFLEIGHDQGEKVKSLCEAAGFETEILKDLAGHHRAVKCKKEFDK